MDRGNSFFVSTTKGTFVIYNKDEAYELETQDKTNPHYYKKGVLEPIDAIDKWDLGFNRGNVIKYVVRAGKKSVETELLDLEKAKYYLEWEINKLRERNQ